MIDPESALHTRFREALALFVDAPVPEWAQMYTQDEEWIRLQDWVCAHVRPKWATGIAAIESAEHMVREAISNANIDRRGNLK